MLNYCPICNDELEEQVDSDDLACPSCNREWYEDENGFMMSRKRKVRLNKLPEVGDNINDIIEEE